MEATTILAIIGYCSILSAFPKPIRFVGGVILMLPAFVKWWA